MDLPLINNPSQGFKDARWAIDRTSRSINLLNQRHGPNEMGYFLSLYNIFSRALEASFYLNDQKEAIYYLRRKLECGVAICRSWLNPGKELSSEISGKQIQFTGRRDIKWWGYGFWDAFLLRDQDTLIDFADYISQRMDIDPDYPKNPFQEAQLHYQMALFRGQPNRQALAQNVVDSYRREFLGDFQLEINYQRVSLPAQSRLAIESRDEKAYNETLIQLIQAEVQNYLDDPEDSLFHNYQETINCLAAQAHDAGLKRNFESDLIFGEIERGEFSL